MTLPNEFRWKLPAVKPDTQDARKTRSAEPDADSRFICPA